MEIISKFWAGKKVIITGHNGFKGSWLSLWLSAMGAEVLGISIEPPSKINNFKLLNLKNHIINKKCDIKNYTKLNKIFTEFKPEIVFHLAAQPLVIESYENPQNTYQTNVIGTQNVLESIRHQKTVRAGIMVTSDKCYENKEQMKGYVETDSLGGHDPYSSSKAAAEILINSYRRSYFDNNNIKIASVRAGNVIGGGDFGKDRLLPDAIKSIMNKKKLNIRNPNSIRPWQHVLEPLGGYIELAEKLYLRNSRFDESWNFGPNKKDMQKVEDVIDLFKYYWGSDFKYLTIKKNGPHEAKLLSLDCTKIKKRMKWAPKWNLDKAIIETVSWYKAFIEKKDLYSFSLNQIINYKNYRN